MTAPVKEIPDMGIATENTSHVDAVDAVKTAIQNINTDTANITHNAIAAFFMSMSFPLVYQLRGG